MIPLKSYRRQSARTQEVGSGYDQPRERGHSRWISQSWHGRNRVSGPFDTSGAVKYSPGPRGPDLNAGPDKSETPLINTGREGGMEGRERAIEVGGGCNRHVINDKWWQSVGPG